MLFTNKSGLFLFTKAAMEMGAGEVVQQLKILLLQKPRFSSQLPTSSSSKPLLTSAIHSLLDFVDTYTQVHIPLTKAYMYNQKQNLFKVRMVSQLQQEKEDRLEETCKYKDGDVLILHPLGRIPMSSQLYRVHIFHLCACYILNTPPFISNVIYCDSSSIGLTNILK